MATHKDRGFQILTSRLIDFLDEISTQEDIASVVIDCLSSETSGRASFKYYLNELIDECKRKQKYPKLVRYLEEAIVLRDKRAGPLLGEEGKEFMIKIKGTIEELRVYCTIKDKDW